MRLVKGCKVFGQIAINSIIASIIFVSPLFAGDKNDVISNNTTGGNENGGITDGSYSAQSLACGDMNDDGMIDILDIDFFIDFYFLFGPAPTVTGVGDTNCDGFTDIGDIVSLSEYLVGISPSLCCGSNGEPGRNPKELSPKDKIEILSIQ